MLNKIVLENFKGYREETVIPMAPITLLYGNNSAGKSSIFHALLFAYEVLKNDWCDVDVSTLANVDLGGFLNLVNRNSAESWLRIGLEFDFPFDGAVDFRTAEHGSRGFGSDSADLDNFCIENGLGIISPSGEAGAETASLDFTIHWNEVSKKPYVSSMKVGLDYQDILTITANPDTNRVYIGEINFDHTLLNVDCGDGISPLKKLIRQLTSDTPSLSDSDEITIPITTGAAGAKPPLGQTLRILFPEERKSNEFSKFWGSDDEDIERSEEEEKQYREEQRRIEIYEAVLRELFTQAVVTPIHAAAAILGSMAAIGPMRAIPARNFIPYRRRDPSRWYEGLGGWDIAYSCSDEELSKISQWMFRLRTGYTLARERNSPSNMNIHGEKEMGVQVTLRDLQGNHFFAPDVGIGISQLLPVVVATCVTNIGVIYVEQPELHIHPALQVELGDLLCAHISPVDGWKGAEMQPIRGNDKQFLFETHSEHLLLRLLRRIRQTSEGEIALDGETLSPDDLAVVYIDNSQGDSTANRLRVREDGEFIDPWPKGFFRERGEELI